MFSYQNERVQRVKESISHYRQQQEGRLPKTIFISKRWDCDRQVRNFIKEEFQDIGISEETIFDYYFM